MRAEGKNPTSAPGRGRREKVGFLENLRFRIWASGPGKALHAFSL